MHVATVSDPARPLADAGDAMSRTASDLIPSASVPTGALSLDVVNYADERADDLVAVAALMPPPPFAAPTATVAVRPARQQERLLRRRGGSITVWRWRTRKPLPATTREKLLHHSRRDRRRAALLRARTEANGGLETETWHAKRFEMARIFGLRLPWRANDRAEASAVRAANEGCVLHDASYWRCLRMSGERGALLALLGRMTDAPAALLAGRLGRGREVCCMLHRLDACPAMAVGPVRLLLCHPTTATTAAATNTTATTAAAINTTATTATATATTGDDDGTAGVWLFVHAAAAAHARVTLRDAAATLGGVVVTRGPALLRFQLRGPTSHAILTRALCVPDEPETTRLPPAPPGSAGDGGGGRRGRIPLGSSESQAATSSSVAWECLSALSSPVSLPPGVVLGITATHPDQAPAPTPPPRRSVGVANPTLRGGAATRELRDLTVSWPPSLAASALFRDDGGKAAARAAVSAAVSVLLVQQPSLAGVPTAASTSACSGERRGRTRVGRRVNASFGGGWDLLLPAGSSAGRAVWRALVLAGARAIGQSELRAIHLHADSPLFPYDAPDTLAGLVAELTEAGKRYAAHASRPPSRRPNHTALRVAQPFGCDFAGLLGVPRTEVSAQPQAEEGTGAGNEGGEGDASAPRMHFGLLRGSHAAAVCAAASAAARAAADAAAPSAASSTASSAGGGEATAEAQQTLPLPPLLRALLPRMLLRVTLHFPAKGCARAPASVFAPRREDLNAFLAGRAHARASGTKGKAWGGTCLPAHANVPLPAGPLVGFVSHGGYNRLLGHGAALAFVAAGPFCELLGSGAGGAHVGGGQVLLLARNPWSRQFRPALAEVRL